MNCCKNRYQISRWIGLSLLLTYLANVFLLRSVQVAKTSDKLKERSNSSIIDECDFPIIDPWHASILDFMEKDGSIECERKIGAGMNIVIISHDCVFHQSYSVQKLAE